MLLTYYLPGSFHGVAGALNGPPPAVTASCLTPGKLSSLKFDASPLSQAALWIRIRSDPKILAGYRYGSEMNFKKSW
jgi:hypothetical protein